MRRGARQSQIVNNFFSLATIIMVSVVLVLYVKYIVKEPARINSGLFCQNEIKNTTDKISNQKYLKNAYKLLNKGFFILDGGVLPSSKYVSLIPKKIDINLINNIFLKNIDIKLSEEKRIVLKIKYELIENEDEEKDNVASLLTSFRLSNKEVFRMFIDINSFEHSEIERRIQCIMDAFKHNATI